MDDNHTLDADTIINLMKAGQKGWAEIDRRLHETKLPPQQKPLVYKTKTFERQPAPQASMDQATQAAWDNFVKQHIRNALAEQKPLLTKAVAQFVSTYVRERLDTTVEMIGAETGKNRADDQKLWREEIAALRTEVETLRAELIAKDDDTVLEWPRKGKRDVA